MVEEHWLTLTDSTNHKENTMLALWEAGVQEDSVQDFEMQEYDPALIAMRCGDDFADAAMARSLAGGRGSPAG